MNNPSYPQSDKTVQLSDIRILIENECEQVKKDIQKNAEEKTRLRKEYEKKVEDPEEKMSQEEYDRKRLRMEREWVSLQTSDFSNGKIPPPLDIYVAHLLLEETNDSGNDLHKSGRKRDSEKLERRKNLHEKYGGDCHKIAEEEFEITGEKSNPLSIHAYFKRRGIECPYPPNKYSPRNPKYPRSS